MQRPIIVAECGINHNGDVELAKAMIAVAAGIGVDYVKFQKRMPEAVYSSAYLNRHRPSRWGSTIREEKVGLELTKAEYDQIDAACKGHGIGWFASVWDEDSLDFLLRYSPAFLKISSACLNHERLLVRSAAAGPPIIISTGMSTENVIQNAVSWLRPGRRLRYALHCVALYPSRAQDMHMARLKDLRRLLPPGCDVGFSNHYPDTLFCLQAAILGVSMIEVHFTVDKTLPGPDHSASFGPADLSRLMRELAALKAGWGSPEFCPSPGELAKGVHYKWRQSGTS